MRIADILKAKHDATVVTIAPDAGVRELLALLAEHNVGALIVSSDGESLDGIVSERDVVRHLHDDGTVLNNTVRAIMTELVETAEPSTQLDELMEVMTVAASATCPSSRRASWSGSSASATSSSTRWTS